MSGCDSLRIRRGITFQSLVVPVDPGKAIARCFVERDAKLHLRHRVDNRFVDIFNGLDEVALPDNNVSVLRNFQADRFQFHIMNRGT